MTTAQLDLYLHKRAKASCRQGCNVGPTVVRQDGNVLCLYYIAWLTKAREERSG